MYIAWQGICKTSGRLWALEAVLSQSEAPNRSGNTSGFTDEQGEILEPTFTHPHAYAETEPQLR